MMWNMRGTSTRNTIQTKIVALPKRVHQVSSVIGISPMTSGKLSTCFEFIFSLYHVSAVAMVWFLLECRQNGVAVSDMMLRESE